MISMDMSGRRALVTGASLGIGAAIVRMLADHGAQVTFCARDKGAVEALAAYEPQSVAGGVTGMVVDMADGVAVAGFLDDVEKLGNIDILINNVGASPSRNFLYMTDADWLDLIELNLMSAVRCTRRLLPAMRKQQWGRVVMIASGAAKYPGAALIDYGASKAAMVAMAKALSRKYGADNVLINSVLPGLIHTAMWDRAASEVAAASQSNVDEVLAANAKSVPVGRYGRAEEVASVVTFLCSSAASYVNGTAIEVDGGQGAHT